MSRNQKIDSPVVWLFITGIEEDRHVRSVHATRESACAELCDLAMRGQEMIAPKIERKVMTGAEPLRSDNIDQVAAVIKAYRGLASAGKTDLRRASLGPLRAALDALAYPMAVPDGPDPLGALHRARRDAPFDDEPDTPFDVRPPNPPDTPFDDPDVYHPGG